MDTDKPNTSRRLFLMSAAAVTAGACTSTRTATEPSAKSSSGFVIAPPDTVSMAFHNSTQRFPVRRVFCLGRNYRAHAIESGDNPDETPPFFFIKPRDAVTDYRDGFPYPQVTKALRYEAEMVVALAKGGNNIDQPPFSPMYSANLRFPGPFLQKQIPSSRSRAWRLKEKINLDSSLKKLN